MSEPKTFRLFLLRHGNTFETGQTAYQVGCKTDLPLTAKGVSQAEQFAHFLQKHQYTPDKIYCGFLQRQAQTAALLKTQFVDAQIIYQEALNEIDYGAWEGLTADSISQQWSAEYQAWHDQAIWPQHIFPQSLQAHTERLQAWWEKLLSEAPSHGIVVGVSSGGILKLLLQFMPTLWQEITEKRLLNQYKVGTGHYCEILFKAGQPEILTWNGKP